MLPGLHSGTQWLSVLVGELLRVKQYPSVVLFGPREHSAWGVLFFAWQPCCRIARLKSRNLGQWLCAPPFRMVRPLQSNTMLY